MRVWLIFSCGLLVVPGFWCSPAVAEDPKQLEGTWMVVSARRNGADAPEIKTHRLILKGDTFRILKGDKVVYGGTYSTDTSKKPAAIDFTNTEGEAKGKKWLGIFQLDKGMLIICDNGADPTQPRPTELLGPPIRPGPGRVSAGEAMIVTTTFTIEGHEVIEYLGVVRGIIVRAPTIAQGILGGLKNLLGCEIGAYIQMCEQARQQAYEAMIEHARLLGANAILGMAYDAAEVVSRGSATEVLCYGTAVVVRPIQRAQPAQGRLAEGSERITPGQL